MRYALSVIIILLIVCFSIIQCSKSDQEQTAEKVVEQSLEQKVGVLFQEQCATAGCHRGEYPKKKLNLEAEKFVAATVGVPSIQIPDLKLIDVQDPENSYVLKKVRGDEDIVDDPMPEEAPPLTEEQIKLILDWAKSLQDGMKAVDSTTAM